MSKAWRNEGSVECVIAADAKVASTGVVYDVMVAEGAGTRVTHAYRITKYPSRPVKWLYGRLFPQHRDMRQQMTHTLEALRSALEADTSSTTA